MTSPHLSRELLLRAVAHRMQEVAVGGLRPPRQRQLRQVAQQLTQTGAANTRPRAELKAGTRLVREWQGRTYDVLVLDGGFSWQDTHYRSLSALARKITGTAWVLALTQTSGRSGRATAARRRRAGRQR
jgi:hypothetical protein